MDKSLDQRLHEWLFPDGCWHQPYLATMGTASWSECAKCFQKGVMPNPRYSSDGNAILLLIEAMREKGVRHFTEYFDGVSGKYYVARFKMPSPYDYRSGYADTLPMAVALAADKVREMEGKSDE